MMELIMMAMRMMTRMVVLSLQGSLELEDQRTLRNLQVYNLLDLLLNIEEHEEENSQTFFFFLVKA